MHARVLSTGQGRRRTGRGWSRRQVHRCGVRFQARIRSTRGGQGAGYPALIVRYPDGLSLANSSVLLEDKNKSLICCSILLRQNRAICHGKVFTNIGCFLPDALDKFYKPTSSTNVIAVDIWTCHPERSEGSGSTDEEILRCAQDDSRTPLKSAHGSLISKRL